MADEAIIITCGGSGSLRGAERMARVLEDDGVMQVRLVVNRIRRRLIRRGAIGTVDDAMDATGLCLLGIVPEDEAVSVAAGVPESRYSLTKQEAQQLPTRTLRGGCTVKKYR